MVLSEFEGDRLHKGAVAEGGRTSGDGASAHGQGRYRFYEVNSDSVLASILPRPRRALPQRGGYATVSPSSCLMGDGDDPRVAKLVSRICHENPGPSLECDAAEIVLVLNQPADPAAQGYRLEVSSARVAIAASSAAGLFYGLQTMRQLAQRGSGLLPCCTIEDAPDFPTRGVLLDVTRGRVPTLAALKAVVDHLSELKINQLQLYIEHAFVFSFDPHICDSQNGLTPEEISELDGYAKERFVQLVPAVATLGHMGKILSIARYRKLAEYESTIPWDRWDWPARARGLTLDCRSPEAWKLVERIWSDILDAFASPIVNICGDEPWDLGRGKNQTALSGEAKGAAYLDHISRTHALCADRGRQTCFWSDVVRSYPHLFHRIPRDATLLHWGYDDDAAYAQTHELIAAGLSTVVCPATSAFKRIVPAMDLAERNIATFARVGKQAGATGLITTDWGDHGHFNPPACSRHGLALGACLAWDAGHAVGTAFDAAFSQWSGWASTDDPVAALRQLGRWGETYETWPLLWKSPEDYPDSGGLPPRKLAEQSLALARMAADSLGNPAPDEHTAPDDGDGWLARIDRLELASACSFSALLARKIMLVIDGRCGRPHPAEAMQWSEDVADAAEAYAATWVLRSKPSGLRDIMGRLTRMAEDVLAANS